MYIRASVFFALTSLIGVVLSWPLVGCQQDRKSTSLASIRTAEVRVETAEPADAQLTSFQDMPQVAEATPVMLVGEITPQMAEMFDKLHHHLPDPVDERVRVMSAMQQARNDAERRNFQDLLDHLDTIRRPNQIRLGLADAIQRALAHNYGIRIAGYFPAIDTATIVEAEAAFDAVFFMDLTIHEQDQPTGSELYGSRTSTRTIGGGVRKLTPTGMLVSASLDMNRYNSDMQFQLINPQYTSHFNLEFRQPLMRGFGLDYNRSQIELSKHDRRISNQQFKRQIRDLLRDVERAYWKLVYSRRNVTITARLLADYQQVYDYLERRTEFDAYRAQISLSQSRLEMIKADFIRVKNTVRDDEDSLVHLMNDPTLNLSQGFEILPIDIPTSEELVVDQLAEVQTSLDNRSEIAESQLNIERARIITGVAKNQAMPRLDLIFRYTISGLGGTCDSAFDELTRNNYADYYVGIELEWPIGNRGPRAAIRRARLQHAQAVAALKQTFEQIILEVNTAVRELRTNYDQITPSVLAADASENWVSAIVARAERKDPLTLQQELDARWGLADNRRSLLDSLVRYNYAVVNLESAKGTLLGYNNVTLSVTDD